MRHAQLRLHLLDDVQQVQEAKKLGYEYFTGPELEFFLFEEGNGNRGHACSPEELSNNAYSADE